MCCGLKWEHRTCIFHSETQCVWSALLPCFDFRTALLVGAQTSASVRCAQTPAAAVAASTHVACLIRLRWRTSPPPPYSPLDTSRPWHQPSLSISSLVAAVVSSSSSRHRRRYAPPPFDPARAITTALSARIVCRPAGDCTRTNRRLTKDDSRRVDILYRASARSVSAAAAATAAAVKNAGRCFSSCCTLVSAALVVNSTDACPFPAAHRQTVSNQRFCSHFLSFFPRPGKMRTCAYSIVYLYLI